MTLDTIFEATPDACLKLSRALGFENFTIVRINEPEKEYIGQ